MNQRNNQSARRYDGNCTHQEFHADAPLIGQVCLHTEPAPVTLQVILLVNVAGFKKIRH